jgi:hypothetical protein
MKYLFLILAAAAVLMVTVASCGIESIEVIPKLSPPLGITLSNVGGGDNGIIVSFYALNDETYLEGYNIYMADTSAALLANTGFRAVRADLTTNIPTIPNVAAMSTAQLFTFPVPFYTNITSGRFQVGITYFFCVKAFSGTYIIESRASEITNIVYSTN